MPDFFTLDMFTSEINSKFTMHYGKEQSVELRLLSAADVGSSPRQQQFSLIFQGPTDAPAFQSIFRLDHEKFGALSLFLVPIGRNNEGIQYEAIFNRVIE